MPFGKARLVDIHLAHRAFMYLASLLLISLIVLALRRRPSPGVVRLAWLLAILLVVQITLGALNVWLDVYEGLIVAHLAVGTLLWATAVGLTLQLYPIPAAAPERAARHRTEPVTA
jgi:heme A synthase